MTTIKHGPARNLRAELEAIASEELADVLASWGRLSVGQAERLWSYLRAEIAPCGMLSAEKAREAGHYLATERAEARRVMAAIERGLKWPPTAGSRRRVRLSMATVYGRVEEAHLGLVFDLALADVERIVGIADYDAETERVTVWIETVLYGSKRS